MCHSKPTRKPVRTATWYPSSVAISIHRRAVDGSSLPSLTFRAPTWKDACRIAKENGADEIRDVLGRWLVDLRVIP